MLFCCCYCCQEFSENRAIRNSIPLLRRQRMAQSWAGKQTHLVLHISLPLLSTILPCCLWMMGHKAVTVPFSRHWALNPMLDSGPSNFVAQQQTFRIKHVSVWGSVSEEQPKYPNSTANLLPFRELYIFFICKPPYPESHYTIIAVAGTAMESREGCRKD